MAIFGDSYGGYLVLAALAFRPDVFAAGVDFYGITNWLTALEEVPTWWEGYRAALYAEMGDPVADREMIMEISPYFHADRIRQPVIIFQGRNDARVSVENVEEMVGMIRRSGVPVEYLLFEDEGDPDQLTGCCSSPKTSRSSRPPGANGSSSHRTLWYVKYLATK